MPGPTTDRTAYCGRCGRDDLDRMQLCGQVIDNGADRDRALEPARFEGICGRDRGGRPGTFEPGCCGHNHA